MVSLSAIHQSNAQLSTLPPGLVFVFAGATAGIGLSTLQALAKHANAPRCYIFGRSEEKANHFIDRLKAVSPMGTFIFIEGEASLIKEVDRMCDVVREYEGHVDAVVMTLGRIRLGGRSDTEEGIEMDLSLQYYARMRIVINLLPLLERSVSPRVISVLLAGFEHTIDTDDLSFSRHWNFITASLGASTMTSLTFEELAKSHPTISFIHSYPGKVGTGIVDDLFSALPGLFWYWGLGVRLTVLPFYKLFVCMSPQEAGERTLFLATSTRYPPAVDHEGIDHEGKGLDGWVERPEGVGIARSTIMEDGRGNGVYRVTWNGESCPESRVLERYRRGWVGSTVMDHVFGVWEKALRRRDLITPLPFSKESFFGYVSDSDFLDFEVEL